MLLHINPSHQDEPFQSIVLSVLINNSSMWKLMPNFC